MLKTEAINEAEYNARLLGKKYSVIQTDNDFEVVKGEHPDAVYNTKKGWL